MEVILDFFNKLAANFDLITIGLIVLVVVLLLIIVFTGKKSRKSRSLKSGKDLSLDNGMDQLRDTSDSIQLLINDYRAKIGEQDKLLIERQMELQKLEQQVYQMKSELQQLDDAPQELKDKIENINYQSAKDIKRKLNRNNYIMLFIGFILGVLGFTAGRFYETNAEMVMNLINRYF